MRVWRIASATHAPFDGEGARRHGSRWTPRGIPAVFTSATLSLAALERFVHTDSDLEPTSLVAIWRSSPRHQMQVVRRSHRPASASDRHGPDAVGVAVARIAPLALDPSHLKPRERHRLAPPGLSPFLDLEEPTPHWTSERVKGRARPHSRALVTESALGCAANLWRAAEAGRCRQ